MLFYERYAITQTAAIIFQDDYYYRVEKNDDSISCRITEISMKRAKDFVGFYERSPVENLSHQVAKQFKIFLKSLRFKLPYMMKSQFGKMKTDKTGRQKSRMVNYQKQMTSSIKLRYRNFFPKDFNKNFRNWISKKKMAKFVQLFSRVNTFTEKKRSKKVLKNPKRKKPAVAFCVLVSSEIKIFLLLMKTFN